MMELDKSRVERAAAHKEWSEAAIIHTISAKLSQVLDQRGGPSITWCRSWTA